MNIVWKKPDNRIAVTYLSAEALAEARKKALADGVIVLGEQLSITEACRIEGEKLKARGYIPADWVAVAYNYVIPDRTNREILWRWQ